MMPTSPAAACLEPRCPGRAVPGGRGRCERHVQSQAQRGYGAAHQRARDALRATLPALCGYGCGRLLQPSGDWVAAHRVDGNAAAGYLASCRTCNEHAKGSAGIAPSKVAQGATPSDPRDLSRAPSVRFGNPTQDPRNLDAPTNGCAGQRGGRFAPSFDPAYPGPTQ